MYIVDAMGKKWKMLDDGSRRPWNILDEIHYRFMDWKGSRDWNNRQREFEKSNTRYYGDGGTIHHTTNINVELYKGKVVGVWFRCQYLPFTHTEVDIVRSLELNHMYEVQPAPEIHGVEVKDRTRSSKFEH